jgi:hypothetical protein
MRGWPFGQKITFEIRVAVGNCNRRRLHSAGAFIRRLNAQAGPGTVIGKAGPTFAAPFKEASVQDHDDDPFPETPPKLEEAETRAIVCGITADLAFALGSLLVNFTRYHPDFQGDFVIFHDGLSKVQQEVFDRIGPKLRFLPLGATTVWDRFYKHAPGVKLEAALGRYSPLHFAKFEMLDLLQDYDKCLWLDVDILLRARLDPIWEFDELTWRPLPEGAFKRRAEVLEVFAPMRKDPTTPLLNGGVVGMARRLRDVHGLQSGDLYALAADILVQSQTTSVDELAIHLIASARSLDVRPLDLCFNHPITSAGVEEAVVIHAIGPDKFWNSTPLIAAFRDWQDCARAWALLDGDAYAGPLRLDDVHPAGADASLKAALARAFWLDIYDRLRPDLPPGLQVDLRCATSVLRLFFAGAPEALHLRLLRQPNDRRMRVELHFPEDEALGAALFAQLDAVAVPGLPQKAEMELARGKQGWSYAATVPVKHLQGLIQHFNAAVIAAKPPQP